MKTRKLTITMPTKGIVGIIGCHKRFDSRGAVTLRPDFTAEIECGECGKTYEASYAVTARGIPSRPLIDLTSYTGRNKWIKFYNFRAE